MSALVLSIGSNIDREKHIRFALEELERLFGPLRVSPVYESRSVGFDGPDFYNLVVAVETSMELEHTVELLQDIERQAGRVRGEKRFESRRLDVDILLYGEADLHSRGWDIPRHEIYHAAYVLKPLADLLPEMCHPVSGERFESMWKAYDDPAQMVKKIAF